MSRSRSAGPLRTGSRSAVRVLGVLAAIALAASAGLLFAWPVVNSVETGQSAEYPSLQPVTYPVSEERATAAVRDAVAGLAHWELSGDVSEATLRDVPAIALSATTSAWGPLPDSDIVVLLASHGEGGTIASVRSSSPHVRGDLGQNARNVRTLLAAIDAALLR